MVEAWAAVGHTALMGLEALAEASVRASAAEGVKVWVALGPQAAAKAKTCE